MYNKHWALPFIHGSHFVLPVLHCRHFQSYLVDGETEDQQGHDHCLDFPAQVSWICRHFSHCVWQTLCSGSWVDKSQQTVPWRCCKGKSVIWLGWEGKEFCSFFPSHNSLHGVPCDLLILLLAWRSGTLIRAQPLRLQPTPPGLWDIQEKCWGKAPVLQGLHILRQNTTSLGLKV